MGTSANGPGAALVLLRRDATTTDVMLFKCDRYGAPLPCAATRDDASQRSLLEDLILETGPVDRLYASTLAVPGKTGPLGVFVAFAKDPATLPPEGAWLDLRDACQSAAPVWSAALSAVRERFVARPPDEALRIR
jgi:hypothetical protein